MFTKRNLFGVLLFLSIICICGLVYLLSFTKYQTQDYANNTESNKGLYAYQLADLRLLFARDKKISTDNHSMILLHQNDFWDSERCAGMIPSIYHDHAFFVDKRIEIGKDGNLAKKSTIYNFNFTDSILQEISSPLQIERVFRRSDKTYVLSLLRKRIVLVYYVDEKRKRFIFNNYFVLPSGYTYRPKANFLEWCDEGQAHCVTKKEYVGFEDLHRNIHEYHENELRFDYKGETLTIPRSTGNLFLGY